MVTGQINRRDVLGLSAVAAVAMAGGNMPSSAAVGAESSREEGAAGKSGRRFKLGMVTYNLARDWDLKTIVKNCRETGIGAVEFRTTHKHGVEPSLSKSQRAEVRAQCADGGLTIWCLGTACEYHSPDAAVVRQNIEESSRFVALAAELGAAGIKVRPNGLPKHVSEARTLEQIGNSLAEVGRIGADAGVEIWCEMHGGQTCEPPRMRRIMDIAAHPNVGVVWNSNHGIDDKNGSIKASFELMRKFIRSVHINELINGYPYRELFALLTAAGYDRYTMIEAQGLKEGTMEDTIRFIRFYKALWDAWSA